MNTLQATPPPSVNATRLRNMDARRRRILDSAAGMLADGGLPGLTLRALAQKAGVTVPTIYNLVGAKEQVVAALIDAALDDMDAALSAAPAHRGIARAEAAVRASAGLYFGDRERYSAVFRAMQEIQGKPEARVLGPLFRRAGDVFCIAVREAQQDGDLHGRLLPLPLGHHILHAQVETFRIWSIGALPQAATCARALYALYVSLLADATKPTRRVLLDRMQASEKALNT